MNKSFIRRVSLMIAAAVVFAVVVSGCTIMRSGSKNAVETQQFLAHIEGVEKVVVENKRFDFATTWAVIISITLKPGYSVSDPELALDWLLKTAWSVNDKNIRDIVGLVVMNPDGSVAVWNWKDRAEKMGFSIPADRVSQDSQAVVVPAEQMSDRYGPWPARAPEAPADLFVKS